MKKDNTTVQDDLLPEYDLKKLRVRRVGPERKFFAGKPVDQLNPSEEMMQESPFYELIIQRGIEQGIGQGSRETHVKNIITLFTKRFPLEDVQPVAKALESIADLGRLSELHNIAIDIPSIEEFLRELESSEE